MGSVDFTSWAVPDLTLTLGEHTYTVRPPSVEQAKVLLAWTVYLEIKAGWVKGEMPEDLQALIDATADSELGVLSLGQAVHDRLVADGHPPRTIDRMGLYGVLFWTRGKSQADHWAVSLWSPEDGTEGGEGEAAEPAPKARRRSKSGRFTASENPTPTASTPTTESPQA